MAAQSLRMSQQQEQSLVENIKQQVLFELQQSQTMNPQPAQAMVEDIRQQVLSELQLNINRILNQV